MPCMRCGLMLQPTTSKQRAVGRSVTSFPLTIYWIPVMSHFSDQSVITLNMFYISSYHHPNTLVIISVPVDTASPFLLSLQSSCAKTSLTACYSMMIYINVIQTGLYFVYFLLFFILLFCISILYVYTVTVSLCV